ncbi:MULTISPECIES: CopM family metallochaperone [unclassified Bradyrhizobium]|uniref:CopM family metallochaperone n=1 Tax=unclassified Bradyrhizobium TaxID=2631580 RepID=UPI002FEE700D
MKNAKSFLAIATVIAAIGTAAFAQHVHQPSSATDPQAAQKVMEDMAPKDSDAASTKAYTEAHTKMMQDMHQTYTGNADIDFMTGMIPHHQGAIDMAKVLLKYGKDAETRKLAEQIIADQEKEIALMQAWLRKNAK